MATDALPDFSSMVNPFTGETFGSMDPALLVQAEAEQKTLKNLTDQLLAGWQGLGENVGIGSAGTPEAEIGGRRLQFVAEDFARKLQQKGITDLSQAKFDPGSMAAWTAEGKGNVSLVATKDGRLVPVWGSSSDAGKARQVALALGSALVAPGLAGALGGGLAGSAGAGALLGAGRAAITGGDILKGALTGGLTGGAGYGISTLVDPFAADIGKSVGEVAGKTVGEAAKGAISGAARSAVGAGLTGGNIGDALLSGAIGGGANAAIGDTLSGLPKEIRGPVTAAVSAGLLGKDPTQAAIMSFAGSLLKGAKAPGLVKGLSGDIDLSGADAIEGFFEPGGEGYAEPEVSGLPDWALDPYKDEAGNLPDWALDPYKDNTPLFGDWYQEGAIPTYSGVPEWDDALDAALQTGKVPGEADQQVTTTAAKTTLSPQEMSHFLEANIDAPGTIEALMQEAFPEQYRQTVTTTARKDDTSIDPWLQPFVDTEPRMFTVSEDQPQTIEVTGKRPPPADVVIPDWDILPDVAPKSIRDVGTVTQISPDEPLEGTTVVEPDLSVGLPPAVAAPAPTPSPAPGRAPTPSPAPKAADKGMDLSALFALLGAMGQQQPTQAPSPYQTARIDTESPFGLMYGLRG